MKTHAVWKSAELSFTDTGKSGPTLARTARTVSSNSLCAIFDAAAPLIIAHIHPRGKELGQQVAVGGVDLDAGKAGLPGRFRRRRQSV